MPESEVRVTFTFRRLLGFPVRPTPGTPSPNVINLVFAQPYSSLIMKLVVAAGILAQALPVLTEVSEQEVSLSTRNDQGRLFFTKEILRRKTSNKDSHERATLSSSRLGRSTGDELLLKNKSQVSSPASCDPSSSDPDVGILSCGSGLVCKPDSQSVVGGVCVENKSLNLLARSRLGSHSPLKNPSTEKMASATAKECNPTSVDVGILACGPGEQCVENSESQLGGFCSKTLLQRRTQTEDESALDTEQLCAYDVCDCSGFDNATMTGAIFCSYDFNFGFTFDFSGCSEVFGRTSITYTFQPNYVYAINVCYDFTTPNAESFCLSYSSNADETCEATFNGNACSQCVLFPDLYYSCENVGGPIYTSSPIVPSIEECSVASADGAYCEICSDPSTSFDANPNTVVGDFWSTFTCEEVYQANSNNLISEARCPDVVAVAKDLCCIETDETPSSETDETLSSETDETPSSKAAHIGLLSVAATAATAIFFAWN